jgi:hypothetical protein
MPTEFRQNAFPNDNARAALKSEHFAGDEIISNVIRHLCFENVNEEKFLWVISLSITFGHLLHSVSSITPRPLVVRGPSMEKMHDEFVGLAAKISMLGSASRLELRQKSPQPPTRPGDREADPPLLPMPV